jgi:DNA gyrase subunit A
VTSAVNVCDFDDGEEITAVVTTDEFDDGECITMVTRDGYVKRTAAAEFENILSTGIIAADLEDGDELIDVQVTDGNQDLVIATADGMTIRFPEDEVRAMGRNARGVGGIRLEGDDRVVGLVATDEDDDCELLTVTESGYGKRTPLSEYRLQSRYGKGLVDIKTENRNGRVTSVKAVDEDDRLVVMSEDGQIMVTHVSEVSEQGRNTMGVIVMRVEGDGRVATVDVLPEADAADADDADIDDAPGAAGADDGDAADADAAGADAADDE